MGAYAELVRPDRRTLHFVPGGLSSGVLEPDDAVAFQSSLIADATLVDGVPADLRSRFERLRHKHVRGVTDYANFAEVGNLAIGMYEPALQARFLEFYRGRDIPFTERDGSAAPLRTDSYDAVYRHVARSRGKHILGTGGKVWFNGTLDGLLKWARMEGLLRGQRARAYERFVQQMRNEISHGRGYTLDMPTTSVEEIRDLAEFVNQLWGVPTPGGRRYPAPVVRDVLALGWDSAGTTMLARGDLLTTTEDPSFRWMLLRGAFHDREVMQLDSRYLTAAVPDEYLWGPGTAAEAFAWMAINKPATDAVDCVDQLMLIRHHGNRLYLPQRPEVAAALPSSEQTGRWYLMLADHPLTAFACVRARLNHEAGHRSDCRCAAQRLARGTWQKMRHQLAVHRPNLAPALPPDVRVEDGFRMLNRSVELAS